jgi:hypothetical protein
MAMARVFIFLPGSLFTQAAFQSTHLLPMLFAFMRFDFVAMTFLTRSHAITLLQVWIFDLNAFGRGFRDQGAVSRFADPFGTDNPFADIVSLSPEN